MMNNRMPNNSLTAEDIKMDWGKIYYFLLSTLAFHFSLGLSWLSPLPILNLFFFLNIVELPTSEVNLLKKKIFIALTKILTLIWIFWKLKDGEIDSP